MDFKVGTLVLAYILVSYTWLLKGVVCQHENDAQTWIACINDTIMSNLITNYDINGIHRKIDITSLFVWKNENSKELFRIQNIISYFRREEMDSCLIFTTLPSIYIYPMFQSLNMTFVQLNILGKNATVPSIEDCEYHNRYQDKLSCDQSMNGKYVAPVVKGNVSPINSVLTTIVYYMKWKYVTVFYEPDMRQVMDEFFAILSLQGIIIEMSEFNETVIEQHHVQIDSSADWSKPVRLHIIVICHSKCDKMMNMLNTYDEADPMIRALRHFSEVLILSLSDDVKTMTSLLSSKLDNVVVFAMSHGRYHTLTIQELEHVANNFVIAASKIFEASNYTQTSIMLLKGIEKFQDLKACEWFPVYTLMWKKGGRKLDVVGHVNTKGNMVVHTKLFPNTVHGLNGRHFHATTVELTPFVMRYPNGTFYGLCIDIFDEIANRFNFTYELTLPPDGEWGTELDNESWTGAVGQLQRKEKDFAVTSLTIHSLREQVMDFTYPFYYDYTTIAMKKMNPNDSKWLTLIKPFNHTVLICIGLALLLSSFCLYLLEKVNPYYDGNTPYEDENRFVTYQHSFWYLYGALLTQGGHRLPYSQTGRTFLSCWWLFCMVTMATYTGNLIAFLTVSKDELPFESIAEMVKQDKYKWGTLGGTYFITLFKESKMEEFKKIWKGIQTFNTTDPSVLSTSTSYHISKALTENYVFIGDKMSIDLKMANECSLMTGNEQIMPFQCAFGLPNGSPFTAMFSSELMEIHESGLLHIWKQRQWPKVNLKCIHQYTSAKSITLLDVQSAFYLIGIGIFLGSVTILTEIIYHHRVRNSKGPEVNDNKVKIIDPKSV